MGRSSRPFVLPVVAAAAAALVLSGCSQGTTAEESLDPMKSPLSVYLADVYGTGDGWEEKAKEDNAKTEALVAECMTEEGFEYTPAESNFSVGSDTDWRPDDRDWVEQYGYGMIDSPMSDMSSEAPTDPNQEYVESLSESEQTAYYATLYGEPQEETEGEATASTSTWEDQGCYGAAYHEMQGEPVWEQEEHKPVFDAMNELYTSAQESPELAELDEQWSQCMADAGQSGFAKQYDAQNSISDELNAYYENQTEYIEDDPALDELGKKEIELALIDLDCREKTDYRNAAMKVQWATEEQFIEDHKAELDALVADAQSAS